MKPSPPWRSLPDQRFLIVVLLALTASAFTLAIPVDYALCLAPLGFIASFLLLYTIAQLFPFVRKTSRFVTLDLATTVMIVTKVLQEKGLPFEQRPGRKAYQNHEQIIVLNGLDVKITFLYAPVARNPFFWGTSITIEPFAAANQPLITSLQQRIDTALEPKGLR